MKVLILSRKRSLYSTKRLAEECGRLKAEPVVLDPLRCILSVRTDAPMVMYHGRAIRGIGVVVPRIGTTGTEYSISVVRHFEMMGVPTLNRPQPISSARNKLGCLQILVKNRVRVPETLISRYPRNLQKLLKLVGGTPIILKLLRGTQGTGVIISESPQSVESVLETIWSLGEDIMLQRFIAESKGTDLRVLVLGGRVAASMQRVAREGEFRSNIHRGGVGVEVKLTDEQELMAVKAAQVVGLDCAGVDMLMSKAGPLVIEVNASPGFQGLEAATGQNIARMIIEQAIAIAKKGRTKRRADICRA